jgi:hypothetical protein
MKIPPEGRPAGGGRISALAPPGTYKVTLAVGGHEFTQPLTILKDPHSGGSAEDIRAQVTLLQAIRDNVASAGEMVNRLEIVRKQLDDLAAPGSTTSAPVRTAAVALNQKATELEEHLYQLRLTGGQDGMRWGGKILQKLSHLAGQIQETDYRPTDQQVAVHRQFTARIAELRAQFDRLAADDLARFNAVLKQNGQPTLRTAARP